VLATRPMGRESVALRELEPLGMSLGRPGLPAQRELLGPRERELQERLAPVEPAEPAELADRVIRRHTGTRENDP
jgi:hypothetical protein